ISVRNFTTPIAIPCVSVGRMTEQGGRLGSRNGQGSGMIRLFLNSSVTGVVSPVKSGKVTLTFVTGSITGPKAGALPALSCQVWKCIVSVGPMLIRIRSTSVLFALKAIAGYRLVPPCSIVGKWNAAVLAIA